MTTLWGCQTLQAEAVVIGGSLWSFALAVAASAGAIWGAMQWRYGGTIAKLKERIEDRDEKIRNLEKNGPGGPVAAELAALKARLEPRRLTDDQRYKLKVALMQTAGGLSVIYDGSVPDAKGFANDFRQVFDEAGWKTRLDMMLSGTMHAGKGVCLPVQDLSSYTMGQSVVAEALLAAGIPFEVEHAEVPSAVDARLAITARSP